MKISERKEKILQAVIEDYIRTATPISSSEIQKSHLPALSSATIRNELAMLEEMGYLEQPHTSSGRVPTGEAYKLYVERLMPKRRLSQAELGTIRKYFGSQLVQIKDVLKMTAKVISEITNYTSMAYSGGVENAVIENIRIVKISAHSAIVIIVTDMGVLKDAGVETDEDLSDEFFDSAAKFALSVFKGRQISEIMKPGKLIKLAVMEYKLFFDTIFDILKEYSHDSRGEDIVLEGASKFFEYPEYSDINKAKAIMSVLDAKEQLYGILKSDDAIQLNVTIGTDPKTNLPMSDCAVVTANYTVSGKNIGKAGVIGPLRMDYGKVLSVLDYIGKLLNNRTGDLPKLKTNIENIEMEDD